MVESSGQRMANHPWNGRGQVTWTIQILLGTNCISGSAKAKDIEFCTQVGYV